MFQILEVLVNNFQTQIHWYLNLLQFLIVDIKL